MTSVNQLNLTYTEAVRMWVTGSPPKRFRHSGKENINDVLEEIEIAKDVQAGGLSKYALRAREASEALIRGASGGLRSGGNKAVQDVSPTGHDQNV